MKATFREDGDSVEVRMIPFRRYTPSVSRYWLELLAGLLWSGVGIGLSIVACYWLSQVGWPQNGIGVTLGFGSGFLFYRYLFSRIAEKNIRRIARQPERVCLFAFQAWRSYALIVLMMALGFVLRHSHLPLTLLAIVYASMGTGLALSSSLYYSVFL